MNNTRESERILLILAAFLIIWCAAGCGGGASSKVDLTDYKAVASDFIMNNALIARKIGKVTSLDHFGVGGGSGQVSYNVYRITGTNARAVCHVTLIRDDKFQWTVKQAILTYDGEDFKLPTQRYNIQRKLKIW